MEKLQKALQKARNQRTAANAPDPRTALAGDVSHLPDEMEGPTSRDAAWAAIGSFEPDPKLLEKNLIVSLDANRKATQFDILRTKTQLMMQKNGWSRLGITSPTPACGKTTTALNIALGFTRQADIRVILVEFDLRRPQIATFLGRKPDHDIAEMLGGKASFSEQAVRIRDNLAITMAQHPAADPTAILLNARTHATLAVIEETFAPDIVIFDLPPVLVSDDSRAFMKNLDCSLIIARADVTTVAQIDACEREVAEQTNVLGVVLNQCRSTTDTDYGYGNYGYGT